MEISTFVLRPSTMHTSQRLTWLTMCTRLCETATTGTSQECISCSNVRQCLGWPSVAQWPCHCTGCDLRSWFWQGSEAPSHWTAPPSSCCRHYSSWSDARCCCQAWRRSCYCSSMATRMVTMLTTRATRHCHSRGRRRTHAVSGRGWSSRCASWKGAPPCRPPSGSPRVAALHTTGASSPRPTGSPCCHGNRCTLWRAMRHYRVPSASARRGSYCWGRGSRQRRSAAGCHGVDIRGWPHWPVGSPMGQTRASSFGALMSLPPSSETLWETATKRQQLQSLSTLPVWYTVGAQLHYTMSVLNYLFIVIKARQFLPSQGIFSVFVSPNFTGFQYL